MRTTRPAMRAAILHGPMDLTVEDVARPAPGAGEAVVRVEAALAGGTAAKVWRAGGHARMGAPPLRLGHEGCGVVEAVGEGVPEALLGRRVVPANSAACGACAACARGMSAQCARMTWLTGFFAERVLVPAPIVAGNLHPVPEGLAPEHAALAETLAVVLKGHDRTPVRAGERAVVLGTGAVGLLWVRVLSSRGAHVTAVGRRPERREKAIGMGAAEVVEVGAFEQSARADGPSADLVVEAVGTEAAWRLAVDAARAGGRVHLFGGLPRGSTVTLDAARLHYDELLIAASFHHTPYHFGEALSLLADGFVDAAALIEERVALEDLPAFFRRSFEGGRPLKAAVRPGGAAGREAWS